MLLNIYCVVLCQQLALPAEGTDPHDMALFSQIPETQEGQESPVVYSTESPCNQKMVGNAVFISDAAVGREMTAYLTGLDETPPNRNPGKRPVSDLEGIDLNSIAFSPESASKIAKSVVTQNSQT